MADNLLIVGRGPRVYLPPQSTSFGALTLSQRGDYAPRVVGETVTSLAIDSVAQGTSGHFEANSGRLRVAAGGVGNLSGTYVLNCTATLSDTSTLPFVQTITVEPNTYSVSPFNDGLANILAVSAATLSGKTSKLRPGDFTGSAANHFGKHLYSSNTTFTAHEPSDKPILSGWSFASGSGTPGDCTLSHLKFFKSYSSLTGNMVVIGNTVAASNIAINNCEFTSDLTAARTGGATPAFFRFFIGVGKNGTSNIAVTNSCFSNGVHALGFYGSGLTVTGCRQHDCWGDMFNITPQSDGSDSEDILIQGNCQHDFISNVNNIHPDFLQCYAYNQIGSGGVNNVTVRGNVAFPGFEGMNAIAPATGTAMQGMLMQTAGATVTYSDHTVEGNIFWGNTAHGISYEGDLLGTNLIRNNTLPRIWPAIQDQAHGFNNVPTPTIRVNVDSGTTTIENNVAEAVTVVSGSATQTNNNTGLSRTNITTYSDRFQGSTFNPQTRAEAVSEVRMKVGGPLDQSTDIGAVGSTTANGFYNFDEFTDPC